MPRARAVATKPDALPVGVLGTGEEEARHNFTQFSQRDGRHSYSFYFFIHFSANLSPCPSVVIVPSSQEQLRDRHRTLVHADSRRITRPR